MSASESIISRHEAEEGLKGNGRLGVSMCGSAVAAVREGSWRRVDGGPVAALAAAAVAGDVLTTAHVLYAPDYWEGNQVLARFAETDPAVALAAFVCSSGLLLAVAWLSFGWLSTAVAGLLVVSMGAGAVNNLLLFATGTSLYARLGLDRDVAIHLLAPLLGVVLGVAVARRRGRLPWGEVAAVVAVTLALGAVEVLF
jgi:hypothetical protein